MNTLTLSESTDNGARRARVLYAGSPLCADTTRDDALAFMLDTARKLDGMRQTYVVRHWDGDIGAETDTTLEALRATGPDARAVEAEWTALQLEHDAKWVTAWRGVASCAPNYSRRPHPDSYGAHLPMASDCASMSALTKTTKAERALLAARPVVVSRRPLNDVAPASDDKHKAQHRKDVVAARVKMTGRAEELSLSFITTTEEATWIAGLPPLAPRGTGYVGKQPERKRRR